MLPVAPVRESCSVHVIKFIFTKADVEELEKIKREHPEYIYYISPIDEINSHKIIDSSTRYGYYILAI